MRKRAIRDKRLAIVVIMTMIIASVAASYFLLPRPELEQTPCKGSADCLKGEVTKVVDGDTLYIFNTKIRLVLVDTPEVGEDGFGDAKNFTASLCPVGSQATADQDDMQLYDNYDRMLAVIYCNGKNLNKELLENGHAVILTEHCGDSEFGNESWAKDYGC